jgi:hypothetical protein
MHCWTDAARAAKALYSECHEFYSRIEYYDDRAETSSHKAVLNSAECRSLEVLIVRAASACYALANYVDHQLLPPPIRHGAATIGVFVIHHHTYAFEHSRVAWVLAQHWVAEPTTCPSQQASSSTKANVSRDRMKYMRLAGQLPAVRRNVPAPVI